MTEKSVYIIIVTYNGMQWIDRCLRSTVGYTVIVVDNNSTDDTVSFIKEKFSSVIVLEQKQNLGFGKANNLGISYALGEDASAVFLLNQDAYLTSESINKLAKISNLNPDFGILSPIHLNGEGNKLDRNFSMFLNYDNNSQFYSDAILSKLNGVYEVPFVNAAAWFIPKNTLLNIGGFDPLFFHYAEDDHYCQRLQYHGLKVVVVSDTFVLHDRENRKSISTQPFSPQFYNNCERIFKHHIANPNNKVFLNQWEKIKNETYRSIVISLLKGKFSTFKGYLKLLKLRKQWFKECVKSRQIIVIPQRHYL